MALGLVPCRKLGIELVEENIGSVGCGDRLGDTRNDDGSGQSQQADEGRNVESDHPVDVGAGDLLVHRLHGLAAQGESGGGVDRLPQLGGIQRTEDGLGTRRHGHVHRMRQRDI
jgi:hypothetical protein